MQKLKSMLTCASTKEIVNKILEKQDKLHLMDRVDKPDVWHCSHHDSYDSRDHRVVFFVVGGSPPNFYGTWRFTQDFIRGEMKDGVRATTSEGDFFIYEDYDEKNSIHLKVIKWKN
jgi:hypothetical protein